MTLVSSFEGEDSEKGGEVVLLGGLAVAYGFQMWPALIAICWWPWLTGPGIILGLIAGLVAVTLTESIGATWFGVTAWGRWPLTIHSAGWGIFFNLGIAILVSFFTQNAEASRHRMTFHSFPTVLESPHPTSMHLDRYLCTAMRRDR